MKFNENSSYLRDEDRTVWTSITLNHKINILIKK